MMKNTEKKNKKKKEEKIEKRIPSASVVSQLRMRAQGALWQQQNTLH